MTTAAVTSIRPGLTSSIPRSVTRPPVNKWLVTVSVTFGTLMGALDASIVNVAFTHMRGTVGATVEQITWVSTGFAIATVLVMPLTAFLGRMFGQKRVYMASLVLFLVGSALCGLARSLPALVLFRVIQGLGAGALQPTEQAILRQTFPPKEQGMAMALFALAIMIGPAAGPILGGLIVDNWSWPWIFYINLPVGILGLAMVAAFVREPEDILLANRAAAVKQRKHLDWQGIVLLSVGMAAVQYVLEEGSKNDWFQSALISGLTGLSVVALAAFVIRELTAKVPVVDVTLFKDKTFLSGTLIGSVMFAMLMSATFLLPVFMQELLGFTATQSGIALIPRTAVMMVCIPIVGRLYNKVSPRLFVFFGALTLAISMVMMARMNLQTTASGVMASLLVQGVGFSLMMVPLQTVALTNVPRLKLTDATGLNSLLRQVGGSIGLAVFANLLTRHAVSGMSALAAHVNNTNPLVLDRLRTIQGGIMARGLDAVTSQTAALGMMKGMVAQQAMVISFQYVFLVGALSLCALLPLSFFLKTSPRAEPLPKGEAVHVEL